MSDRAPRDAAAAGAPDRGPDAERGDVSIWDAARDGTGPWRLVSDQVMGGVSSGDLRVEDVAGRPALRLTGTVRLENDGGFLQMARDLDPDAIGAAGGRGIGLTLCGDGAAYNVHLRTRAVSRPWQSYRATVHPGADWAGVVLPWDTFEPHRITTPFDPSGLVRIGLVAIGRAFRPDVAVAQVWIAGRRPG